MLLRHAKSEWPDGMDDLERPLAKRGRKASSRMGAYLAESGLVPDLAVISPARRARETWELARPAFTRDISRRVEPRIYEASAPALLGVIAETMSEIRTLLLVGHNPGFQELARELIGTGSQSALARIGRKYPTAGLVVIDFDIERWSDASPGLGRLERFETPESVGGSAGD
ncbi:MAG: SixA phosphatase family protein [Devosia sp.]